MRELTPTTAQDPALERVCGIRRRHAEMLLAFCQRAFLGRDLIIIVRGSNPASLRLHDKTGYRPKPYGVDGKTTAGGWVQPTAGGPVFFSDYDIHGVYEHRHSGDYVRFYVGNYDPSRGIGDASSVDPTRNAFLNALNEFVCRRFRDPDMFQHGADADYLLGGRSASELKAAEKGKGAASTPPRPPTFAAFAHTGEVYVLRGKGELRRFYESRPGLTWIWTMD